MRFTNFGEKQSFEKESFERKLKTPNLEKESFLKMSKFLNGRFQNFIIFCGKVFKSLKWKVFHQIWQKEKL